MKIIGVCGQPASGKDTVADFFISRGFAHFSTGDILREEMHKAGIPVDRAHMGPFATTAKKERGMGYLAELAADKVTGEAIISGLRAGVEIEILRKRFGDNFRLIAVDAPLQSRYDRAKKRNRPGDDIPFERFREQEENERANLSGAQEVDKVISMADLTIDNSGSKKDLITRLEALYADLK